MAHVAGNALGRASVRLCVCQFGVPLHDVAAGVSCHVWSTLRDASRDDSFFGKFASFFSTGKNA